MKSIILSLLILFTFTCYSQVDTVYYGAATCDCVNYNSNGWNGKQILFEECKFTLKPDKKVVTLEGFLYTEVIKIGCHSFEIKRSLIWPNQCIVIITEPSSGILIFKGQGENYTFRFKRPRQRA